MIATINNKKLHYEAEGNGKPILFVHGWGGSMKSLYKLHSLAAKKYTSIIIDLPGFGESDNPDPEWGVGEYAQHITTFIKSLNLGPVNYFGHSFGGAVGIYASTHFSGVVDKLILCNSAFKREPKKEKNNKKIVALIKNSYIYPYVKKLYYKIFHPDSDILVAPHLEINFRKIVTEDLTPIIPKISNKTLILWGENDRITPVSWAHELNAKINGSRLKIYTDARHGLPLLKPEAVFEEIELFLR